MNEITTRSQAALARLQEIAEQARDYASQAKAPNTKRAYQADWGHFLSWCEVHERAPLPAMPETVALYLADMAEQYKVSTLQRRLASISQAHKLAGHPSPARDPQVQLVMSGIRRTHGVAPQQKAAATVDVIRLMVEGLGKDTLGQRDRALLLIGFAGAFRRSELVSLDVADITFVSAGVVVTLRRSKTDQEG
ncbi:MAG: integrase, partial [Ardenticatenales bacterium]|nr:integrase [Ardenticatenales bacterium]